MTRSVPWPNTANDRKNSQSRWPLTLLPIATLGIEIVIEHLLLNTKLRGKKLINEGNIIVVSPDFKYFLRRLTSVTFRKGAWHLPLPGTSEAQGGAKPGALEQMAWAETGSVALTVASTISGRHRAG